MAGPDVQREGENESRLRMERLASSRARDDRAGQTSWQPPPPVANSSPGGGDQAMGGVARQRQMENRLNLQRRQEEKPEKEEKGEGGLSLRDAMALAKASPTGALASAAPGQVLSKEEIQRGIGRGCIMMLWNSLWLSFGHTIYLIGILFYVAWASKYARKYFPEVGEEWFPSQILKKIPKAALIPIKLAEIVGISFILLWTLMLDIACIGLLALILGVIISAKDFVS
ncbi:MAG: hypothetical protein AAB554_03830 [Patescibacteria group bacterium]